MNMQTNLVELEDVVNGVCARGPHGPGRRLPGCGGQGTAAHTLGILHYFAVGASLDALGWRRLRILHLGDDVHPAGAVGIMLRVVLILCDTVDASAAALHISW